MTDLLSCGSDVSKLTAELVSRVNGLANVSQEYLKLSDVYKMYRSECHDIQLASASSHGLSLALDPAETAPREVSELPSISCFSVLSCLSFFLSLM